MNFELTDDQQLLMTAFDGLLSRYREPPQGVHGYVAYSEALQDEIAAGGFLQIVGEGDFGVLEGALMVEAAATCPVSVELAASALVAPLLGQVEAPLAVASGLGRPVRFLEQARTVCVFDGGELYVGSVAQAQVRPVETVVAYPLAVIEAMPADARRVSDEVREAVARRVRIGIAAEASGLMRGALDHAIQYVKDRQQFGQPLGNFQAIQHRLAEDAQLQRGCQWLALRAADRDEDGDALTACLYAQEAARKVINDCHQFTGAMGLTLEFPLHLWTYRLKYLQGEAGGKSAQAQALAQRLWGADPASGEAQGKVRLQAV